MLSIFQIILCSDSLIRIYFEREALMDKNFEQKLTAYADIIIRVGLNLRAGQRLLVEAPLEAAELVRLVTIKAYDAGARLVNVIWSDEQVTLARYQHAPRDSFADYPDWMSMPLEQTF